MQRHIGWAAAAMAACLPAAIGISSCATGGSYSQAQLAYNACTDPHNSKRQGLDTYWAFVSGVGSSASTCFWAWGAATVAAAVSRAMDSCHQEYADCFLYSTTDGNSDWVQKISDNGGSDGSGDGGGEVSLGDILNLGAAGIQLYDAFSNGGGGGGSGGGSYGGGSGGGSGGGTYDANACAQAQSNAQTCYARWQSLGGGSTGQAGSEKDCYDLYTATAAQVCS